MAEAPPNYHQTTAFVATDDASKGWTPWMILSAFLLVAGQVVVAAGAGTGAYNMACDAKGKRALRVPRSSAKHAAFSVALDKGHKAARGEIASSGCPSNYM